VFVQDLSQLKAVYPRWQSFLANTAQQFFGTADYDTARYLSSALGQQTIHFETAGSSYSNQGISKPGSVSSSLGEHVQGRALLTPDEVMRLGPTRPLILIAGEPPYLLDRVNYLTDPAYFGRFDQTRCTRSRRRSERPPIRTVLSPRRVEPFTAKPLAVPGMQSRHRTRGLGQRRPAGNGTGLFPGLLIVGDPGIPPT
jgi:type IV secretory pathway TraG/TraD family ATPase VirD4